MQNDTFFTIATGEHILQEGYDNVDHLTWHENLGFYKLRWAFDVAIAFIYNTFGFAGIYAFVVIIASLTGLSLFNILLKQKNNIVLSFIATVISMLLMTSNWSFTARGPHATGPMQGRSSQTCPARPHGAQGWAAFRSARRRRPRPDRR